MNPLPSSTDGCSGGVSWFWRNVLRRVPPWEGCCLEHDRAYDMGGSEDDRMIADLAIYACVREKGSPIWALVIFIGVRIFGSPYFVFNKNRFGKGKQFGYRAPARREPR